MMLHLGEGGCIWVWAGAAGRGVHCEGKFALGYGSVH
jgi:hypothetical protein